MSQGDKTGEFKRGWKPLLACAFGIGLGLSPLPTYTGGVFAVALQHQFGWPRGQIMVSSAFATVALILLGTTIGRITDRIGPRPVALASTLAFGVTTAALSLINDKIWSFYLVYAIMAVTSVGTLPVVYGKIVALWFDRHRGLALGMALCTTGLTGMTAPTYVQFLISHVGWRWAYVGLGLLPLLIALPMIALFLPPGSGPARTPDAQGQPEALEGLEIAAAVRGWRYWIIAFSAFSGGLGLGGLAVNIVPLMIDRGFQPALAAQLFGLYGLTVVIGRLLSGWLLDRFWAPMVGCGFMLIPAVGAVMLILGVDTPLLMAVTIVMLGLTSGAEFDLTAYLTSRYFGRRNFGALYGGQYAIFGVGAGFSPALFGFVHDKAGSYNPILMVSATMFVLGGAVLLLLGRYPKLPTMR